MMTRFLLFRLIPNILYLAKDGLKQLEFFRQSTQSLPWGLPATVNIYIAAAWAINTIQQCCFIIVLLSI